MNNNNEINVNNKRDNIMGLFFNNMFSLIFRIVFGVILVLLLNLTIYNTSKTYVSPFILWGITIGFICIINASLIGFLEIKDNRNIKTIKVGQLHLIVLKW